MNTPTIQVADLIAPTRAVAGLRARDKAALLVQLARLAAMEAGTDPTALASALAAREALGSTGVGNGLALPHARLGAVAAPLTWLVRLARPIAYDAVDAAPVDLLVMLLSPEANDAAHLAALAELSRQLRQAEIATAVRAAPDATAMLAALIG